MAEYWKTIPTMFKNLTVHILGGGPSLRLLQRCKWIRRRKCIAVNGAMFLGPFPQLLFFGDAKWYWWNEKEVQAFPGLKVTMNLRYHNKTPKSVEGEPNLIIIKKGSNAGWERREGHLSFCHSSGAGAVSLAARMGAKRIVLHGFDMQLVNGVRNYVPHKSQKTRVDPYNYMIDGFRVLSKQLAERGVKVYNATPGSALPFFPLISLEQAEEL